MVANKEYRLAFTQRAKEIVSQMSLEEKIYLMSGNDTFIDVLMQKGREHYNERPYVAGGNEKLEVPAIKFCDGPRGVDCGTGKSTCFPVSMCRGASFDLELEEGVGHAIGREVIAHGGNFYGGVCINLPYNPGWGRSQETYGNDSFMLGEFGAALVRGVQSENVMACAKHYAFNSMENSRFKVDVTCDKRTEREVYLPHFKRCVEEGVACVMTSYNKYQGEFCGHNDYLMNQVLKDEWDFDGFTMSDFLAGIRDTVKAANGGMNVEMRDCKFFGDKLVNAVRERLVSEEKIDDAALRIVRTILAFDNARKEAGKEYDEAILGCAEHRELALKSAQEGITLIQNKYNCLPFSKDTVKKIALLGRLAEAENIGDHGSSRVYPAHVITLPEGLREILPGVEICCEDGRDISRAKELANEADAVIYVVGYDHDDEGEHLSGSDIAELTMEYIQSNPEIIESLEGVLKPNQMTEKFSGKEGGDRVDGLKLHKEDINLIQETAELNKNSAVILIGGNTILIDEWRDKVASILVGFYPGQEGGLALAQILFGDVNPSGKLPFSIPHDEKDLPQVDWNASEVFYEYYNDYSHLEKRGISPAVPFGFGLSYTLFEVSNTAFNNDGEKITASCTLKNSGAVAGAEVIQMYVGFSNSKIDRPVKLLRGFKRIFLNPGEEAEIIIECPIESLKYYNEKNGCFSIENMPYEVYLGTSCDERDLVKSIVEF